jgi:hypothetical protein
MCRNELSEILSDFASYCVPKLPKRAVKLPIKKNVTIMPPNIKATNDDRNDANNVLKNDLM